MRPECVKKPVTFIPKLKINTIDLELIEAIEIGDVPAMHAAIKAGADVVVGRPHSQQTIGRR